MRVKLLCIFLSGCAAPLLGQQPVPAPSMAPLPPGPLLKRAPEYSTWSVTFQGTPVAGGALATNGTASGGKGQQKGPVATQLTVIKTGSTILEAYIDAGGQRHAIWHVPGLRVMVQLGRASPLVCPEDAAKSAIVCPDYWGGDIYSINFAVSDFAGLDWISANTYSGMAKYQGRDCIVFRSIVSPLEGWVQKQETTAIEQAKAFHQNAPDKIKVPAVACIDLDTRLPLYVQFGEQKCTYQYGPAPRTSLQLPAPLAGSVNQYGHKIEALSAPAARPF